MFLSVLTAFYLPSLILSVITAIPPSEVKRSGCIKVNRCKCLMRDGSGIVDLGSVAGEDGFLQRLEPVTPAAPPGNTEVLVSFSPCVPFSEPEDFSVTDCTDVAACVITRFHQDSRLMNHYMNYGRHEGNTFSYNDSEEILTVSYYIYSHSEPHTVVHYQCSVNESITHIQSFSVDAPLQIWVKSPCACPNACTLVDVGPGTIFLIVLCLSVTAYFLIGSCGLRAFRSSSGVQMTPEDSVWCMLCYHLNDRPRDRPKKAPIKKKRGHALI
ncbi:uncharacterized protein LOC130567826 [Triplophysa rosa]|uniref:uncharacterized protein LOC130567826 n=1 Tax=Triplophysa rosa TaxID=992332 RepID=UPI002545EDF4|nr:uncharacterized protein LOC130567826 [Triplophysa rosa]